MIPLSTLLLLSIVSTASTGLIVPDPVNPMLFSTNQNVLTGQTISFQFKLSDSAGLSNGQFLGIDLSEEGSSFSSWKGIKNDSGVKLTTGFDYTCQLTDSDGFSFVIHSRDGSSTGTLFCELEEPLRSKTVEPNKTYTLALTVEKTVTLTNSISSVSIFTASSRASTSIQIDYGRTVATAKLYPSFSAVTNNPLIIKNQKVKVTAGSAEEASNTSTILIKDTFTVELEIECKAPVSKEYDFIIEFDEDYLEKPTSLSSKAIEGSSLANQQKLEGDIFYEHADANKLRIAGITEDLVEGRSFVIEIIGFKAKMKTSTDTFLTLLVYYRNSPTIYSYSKSSAAIQVNPTSFITSTVANPDDYPYLVSGASWPFTFTLRPRISLQDTFIAISIPEEAGSPQLRFNSASCDLSASVDTTAFGSAPVCFPFSLYSSGNTTESGLFLKITEMRNNQDFKLTIWAMVNICNKGQSPLDNATPTAFKFKVSTYQNIPQSYPFSLPPHNEKTGDSGNILLSSKCLSSELLKVNDANSEIFLAAEDDAKFTLLLLELNDLQLHNTVGNNAIDSTFFLFDAPTNTGTGNVTATFHTDLGKIYHKISTQESDRIFLFNPTNFASDQNVMLSAISPYCTNKCNLLTNWPSLLKQDASSPFTTDAKFLASVRLEILFHKKWFKQGVYSGGTVSDTATIPQRCTVIWNIAESTTKMPSFTHDFNSTTDTSATVYLDYIKTIPANTATRENNFLLEGSSTNAGSLDSTSKLPQSGQTDSFIHYSIVGVRTDTDGNTNRKYFFPRNDVTVDTGTTGTKTSFYFFTNCLKLKHSVTSSTLMDYFEVQFVIRHTDTAGLYRRVIRLLSFNAMSGIFVQQKIDSTNGLGSPVTYKALNNYSENIKTVCITFIDKSLVQRDSTTSSNTLVLFLLNTTLFETDYNTDNNLYPVGNLATGVKAYSYSTQLPITEADFRIASDSFKDSNYRQTTYINQETADFVNLSSRMMFTGVSTDISAKVGTAFADTLFPHYCQDGTATHSVNPYISYGWYTASKINDFVLIDKKYGTFQNVVGVADSEFLGAKAASTFTYEYIYSGTAVSRDKVYSVDQAKLSVLNANANSTDKAVSTHAGALLLNEKYTVDSTVTITSKAVSLTQMSSVPAYFNGIQYHKMVLMKGIAALGNIAGMDGTIAVTGGTDGTNIVEVNGVKRPSLADLFPGNINNTLVLSLTGIVQNNGSTDIGLYSLTNIHKSTASGAGIAVLSIQKEESLINWEASLLPFNTTKADFSTVIDLKARYSQDNSQITLYPGMEVELDMPQLGGNSVCVIKGPTGEYPQRCLKSGTKFICTLLEEKVSNQICCFNASLANATNDFNIATVKTSYPETTTTGSFAEYVLYGDKAPSKTTFSYATVATPVAPSLIGIEFNHSEFNGALSDMTMRVNLNKDYMQNNTLTLAADLSSLLTAGPTRCQASFSLDFKTDSLISDCTVTSSNVKVDSSSTVFDCSMSSQRLIYIRIWPVHVVNLTATQFTTSLGLKGSGGFASASAKTAIAVEYSENSAAAIVINSNICDVTQIYPRTVGIDASYTFTFSLAEQAIRDVMGGAQKPTEISIYLPFEGLKPGYMACAISLTSPVSCYLTEISFLVVIFKNPTEMHSATTFTLTVANITNRVIGLDSVSFRCMFALVDDNNQRIPLITGMGANKIAILKDTAEERLVFGYLEGSTKLPRQAFQLKTRIIRDKAGSHASISEKTIDKNPALLVSFPSEYLYSLVSLGAASVTLEEYTSTLGEIAKNSLSLEKPEQFGNTLKIPLSSSGTFTLKANVVYFDLVITNLPAPIEETKGTGALGVTITNDDGSTVIRSYSSSNNQFYNKVDSTSKSNLNYFRGLPFIFNKQQWVLDIKNTETPGHLVVSAGFYSEMSISIRDYDELDIFSGKLTVALSSTDVNLVYTQPIEFFTASKEIKVNIGVPCNTHEGSYIVTAIASGENKVATVVSTPIILTVKREERTISCEKPSTNIPKNNIYTFKCTAPSPVDNWDITFTKKDSTDIYSNAQISKTILGNTLVGEFKTAFASFDNTINSVPYLLKSTNSCMTMQLNSIELEMIFPLSAAEVKQPVESDFENLDFITRPFDTALEFNEIKFNYTMPNFTQLSCVIYCSETAEPADSVVIGASTAADTADFKYFSQYIQSSTDTYSSVKQGFRKQSKYNIKCMLASSSTDGEAKRIFKTFTQLGSGTNNRDIELSPIVTSRCLQFKFDKPITDEIKQQIVNYCTNIYSGVNNDCVICTDIDEKISSEGVSIDRNTCKSKLRELQEEQSELEPSVFVVCSVMNYLCTNSIDDSQSESFIERMQVEIGNQEGFSERIKATVQVTSRVLEEAKLLESTKISDNPMGDLVVCSNEKDNSATCIYLTDPKWEYKGNYEFNLKFYDNLLCYYNILEDATVDDEFYKKVMECSNNKCGKFYTIDGVTSKLKSTTETKFETEKKLMFYVYCPHRKVINSTQLSTKVVKIYDLGRFDKRNGVCPKPDSDIDPYDGICDCKSKENETEIILQGEEGDLCWTVYLQLSFWFIALYFI